VIAVRRPLILGGLVVAAVGIPVCLAVADQPGAHTVANPCGGVNVSIISEGVPVNVCPAPVMPPATSGGAPTQEILSYCSGIPGCLSDVLYGPGRVIVPDRDTTVHQSQ
jgi:hypothetical protein